MFWVALHFPCLPPQALAPIAAWACQFTPRVSLEPPQELLLEVHGSLRLLGGFRPLTQKLAAGLGELGYPFYLAAASTARAALWLVRGEGETKLESLPVEVIAYPGTRHGFCEPDSESFDPETFSRAWRRTIEFLHQHAGQ